MANAYVTATSYTSFGHAISLFVEMLVSAGWTYKGSGDGVATYNPTAKVFTGTGSGALGWGNAGAWARIQDPGGGREFTVQHNNAGGALIKYSQLAKFTGGSPGISTTPTATDERALRGAYTVPWFVGGTGKAYGSANGTSPYGFWFSVMSAPLTVTFTTGSPGTVNLTAHGLTAPASVGASPAASVSFTTSGTLPVGLSANFDYYVYATPTPDTFRLCTAMPTGSVVNLTDVGTGTHTAKISRCGIMMDPVASVPEDPDPVVLVIGSDSAWLTNLNCHARSTSLANLQNSGGVANGGTVEGAFATMSADRSMFMYVQPAGYICSYPYASTGSTPIVRNGNLGFNSFNGKADNLPFFWARGLYAFQGAATAQIGMKGWSSMARWTTIAVPSGLTTLNNKQWIAMGCWWLPWDGVTVPS